MSLSYFSPAVVISTLVGLSSLTPGWAQVAASPSNSGTPLADPYVSVEIAKRQATGSATKNIAQDRYSFTLTNETSVDILEFYASPQAAAGWETNILGNNIIRGNGDWTTVTLTSRRGCFYDFLAVFADGDKLEKYGVDVCELEAHTYYED